MSRSRVAQVIVHALQPDPAQHVEWAHAGVPLEGQLYSPSAHARPASSPIATLQQWTPIRSYLDPAPAHGLTALDAITRALKATPGSRPPGHRASHRIKPPDWTPSVLSALPALACRSGRSGATSPAVRQAGEI
jgi:hypothetical protein